MTRAEAGLNARNDSSLTLFHEVLVRFAGVSGCCRHQDDILLRPSLDSPVLRQWLGQLIIAGVINVNRMSAPNTDEGNDCRLEESLHGVSSNSRAAASLAVSSLGFSGAACS
jgi:hypothetical protein